MKLIGDAVNDVRRAEVKARPELRGTRYVWIKNEPNLTAKQSTVLDTLSSTNLKTARAWRMRLAFQDIYAQPTRGWGELFFDKWIGWARRSRLEPMKAVARTMEKHREGILAWFDSRISNGLIVMAKPCSARTASTASSSPQKPRRTDTETARP